jgi:hypothetical protein
MGKALFNSVDDSLGITRFPDLLKAYCLGFKGGQSLDDCRASLINIGDIIAGEASVEGYQKLGRWRLLFLGGRTFARSYRTCRNRLLLGFLRDFIPVASCHKNQRTTSTYQQSKQLSHQCYPLLSRVPKKLLK